MSLQWCSVIMKASISICLDCRYCCRFSHFSRERPLIFSSAVRKGVCVSSVCSEFVLFLSRLLNLWKELFLLLRLRWGSGGPPSSESLPGSSPFSEGGVESLP